MLPLLELNNLLKDTLSNLRLESNFKEKNEGLIIAEIELNSENSDYPKPNWLGKEVTGQKKYYNSQL